MVQRIELSNDLESTMWRAAAAMSAEASTNDGTLPGPTPRAGLPERYAARTTALPPVATTTSVVGSVISASISGIEGSSTIWMQPSGAPARTAASESMRTASAQTCLAPGCGLTTIALRVISASMTLKYTVAIGLVTGVSAKITPAGRGSSRILAS